MQFRHHQRFFVALAAGLAVLALTTFLGEPKSIALRFIAGADVFFLLYLGLTVAFVEHIGAPALRARAANPDEGLPLILLVTAAAVTISLVAVFVLIEGGGADGLVAIPAALVAVPLGWLTMHAMVAFHYAHLYYAPGPDADGDGASDGDAGGLQFPGTPEPGLWDFLYYAYVVGMTAQVSDVDVTGARQRRVTLLHGILSFFYNTVILALAVNAAANLSG